MPVSLILAYGCKIAFVFYGLQTGDTTFDITNLLLISLESFLMKKYIINIFLNTFLESFLNCI